MNASRAPVDNSPDELVDAAMVMARYGLSRATLWRWVRDGRLTAYRFGPRKLRFRLTDVEQLLAPVSRERRIAADQRQAVKDLARLNAEIGRRRGGRPFADPADLLGTDRGEREADR